MNLITDSGQVSRRISPTTRLNIARILALVVVIAVSLYVYSIRDQAAELARFGYPGIFLLSILANGPVLLPAPGVLFVFAMGAVFDPFWVAVAAGLGAAVGELSGYLVGFTGQAVVEKHDYYDKILEWMKKNPFLTDFMLFLLAFIPNPLFDLAGLAAGTLRIHVIRFLLVVSIGKILKMLVFAFAGAASFEWLDLNF